MMRWTIIILAALAVGLAACPKDREPGYDPAKETQTKGRPGAGEVDKTPEKKGPVRRWRVESRPTSRPMRMPKKRIKLQPGMKLRHRK